MPDIGNRTKAKDGGLLLREVSHESWGSVGVGDGVEKYHAGMISYRDESGQRAASLLHKVCCDVATSRWLAKGHTDHCRDMTSKPQMGKVLHTCFATCSIYIS